MDSPTLSNPAQRTTPTLPTPSMMTPTTNCTATLPSLPSSALTSTTTTMNSSSTRTERVSFTTTLTPGTPTTTSSVTMPLPPFAKPNTMTTMMPVPFTTPRVRFTTGRSTPCQTSKPTTEDTSMPLLTDPLTLFTDSLSQTEFPSLTTKPQSSLLPTTTPLVSTLNGSKTSTVRLTHHSFNGTLMLTLTTIPTESTTSTPRWEPTTSTWTPTTTWPTTWLLRSPPS